MNWELKIIVLILKNAGKKHCQDEKFEAVIKMLDSQSWDSVFKTQEGL